MEGIDELIAELDDWSEVRMFARGGWKGDRPPRTIETEAHVTKGWHQRSKPHFTARLSFVIKGENAGEER